MIGKPEKRAAEERDLDAGEKRLVKLRVNQFRVLIAAVAQDLRQWPRQEIVNSVGVVIRHREAEGERDHRPEQPRAQLDQMFEQRHRLVVDGIVFSYGHGRSSCCQQNRDQVGGRWSMAAS